MVKKYSKMRGFRNAGDGLGGNFSIKQSDKKRISLGAGEKRGSKRRLCVFCRSAQCLQHTNIQIMFALGSVCFLGIVGKFDSEVSVESSAREREGSGCCRNSIMVIL